jgi:Cysteine rich repeat
MQMENLFRMSGSRSAAIGADHRSTLDLWTRNQVTGRRQSASSSRSTDGRLPVRAKHRRRLILALAILHTAHASDARADVMTTCKSEIGRYCADVSEGEGRIVACLVGQMGHLKATCLADVQELGPMTPGPVRMIFNPAFRASLPTACAKSAARFCPSMTPGEGRVFACLYARSDRIPKACSDAAQAVLELAK